MDLTYETLQKMISDGVHQHTQQHQEPKRVEVLPSFIPRYRCSDGSCGKIHPNPDFQELPKGKCRNCDQFNRKPDVPCTWCNSDDVDEIDNDDLEDWGVKNY